jgi:hypothetical protein
MAVDEGHADKPAWRRWIMVLNQRSALRLLAVALAAAVWCVLPSTADNPANGSCISGNVFKTAFIPFGSPPACRGWLRGML